MANTITIEDAVARMVNVGKIPMGVSLLDYLDAIVSDAENKLEEAKEQELPHQEVQLLEKWVNTSTCRYTFAGELIAHIEWELATPLKTSVLKVSPESGNTMQLELSSVAEWASVYYGIDRFDYEELSNQSRELPNTNTEKFAEIIAKDGLSKKLATRLYISLAYLLEEFVAMKQTNTKLFGSVENINVDSVAEPLRLRALNFKGADPKKSLDGEEYAQFYSKESFRSTIEVAIAMKKLFGKN
jgi:hypothetical protein